MFDHCTCAVICEAVESKVGRLLSDHMKNIQKEAAETSNPADDERFTCFEDSGQNRIPILGLRTCSGSPGEPRACVLVIGAAQPGYLRPVMRAASCMEPLLVYPVKTKLLFYLKRC